MRHVVSVHLTSAEETALARATGRDPAAVVQDAMFAAVHDLVAKGARGLTADDLAERGLIEIGRPAVDR